MPFEGDLQKYIAPPVVETEAQRVIRLARELLDDPRRWGRHTFKSIRDHGEPAYCLLGALRMAHHGSVRPGTGGVTQYVERALPSTGRAREVLGDRFGIQMFNDFSTHAEVLAVLDRAYVIAGTPQAAPVIGAEEK